jgi:hypothetical protein
MDRYPPRQPEEVLAGLLMVQCAFPFMVWPADEGGYAVLLEHGGKRVAGPFRTTDEAQAESERLNAAHRTSCSLVATGPIPGRSRG